MKNTIKRVLLFIILATLLQIKLTAQNLHLTPSYAEAGKKVTFTYTGKLAKKGTKISFICHSLRSGKIPEKTIPYHVENNSLVGSFVVPDSVAYVNVKIINKKDFDNNNGYGYGFNIYTIGVPAIGTFFMEGVSIKLNKYLLNANVDLEKAVSLMEKEYELNPELKRITQPEYLYSILQIPSRKHEAISLAKTYFDEILKTGKDEKKVLAYIDIISNGDYTQSDSLTEIVTKKFPSGITAFKIRARLLDAYSNNKPDTALIIYNEIIRDFPSIYINYKDMMTNNLLTAYYNLGDYDNYDKTINLYVESTKNPSLKMLARQYNGMAWTLYEANKDLERAKGYAEKSLAAEREQDSLSYDCGNAHDTYAAILYKLGNKKEALINQRKAVELTGTTNTYINEKYIEYLIDAKLYDEAKQRCEEFIADKTSTPKIEEYYNTAYMAVTNNNKEFDKSLSKLKNKAEQGYIEQLKSKLTNLPAPAFTLKDLNGKDVKLSDFKGSIVILDFWATWCMPCISSFPAMQKAMNEMKDKNVVFLYINTQDRNKSDNRSEHIRKILREKNTNEFHVILDEKKNDEYIVQAAYKVPGYPSKYIIDRTGKIRYCNVGFAGEEELIKELKTVINIIDGK